MPYPPLIRYPQVQPAVVVLLGRRCGTYPILLPRSSLPTLPLAIHQYTSVLRRRWRHTTCFRNQLLRVGHDWICLPVVHAPFPLPMVDAIQLHPLCWP